MVRMMEINREHQKVQKFIEREDDRLKKAVDKLTRNG